LRAEHIAQVQAQGVCRLYVQAPRIAGKALSQNSAEIAVDLYRERGARAREQRGGKRPGAGAYLDGECTRRHGCRDALGDVLGDEEMLTETPARA
jgi:hypothetical protein